MGIHWALGDAGAGLHAAWKLRPEHFPTPERRARCTPTGQGRGRSGKPTETARALLDAHAKAPAEVRNRLSIRSLTNDLIRDHHAKPGVRLLTTTLTR